MNDSFSTIVGRVQLRVPAASRFLAEDNVRNAWRETNRSRQWSWRRKYGQFIFPALVNAGTVTATQNSPIITGSGTAWTVAMAGRQFRVNVSTPIYTIVSVESATQLTLDNVYGGATVSATGYQIYQAYVTVPSDFESFVSLFDPKFSWQLSLDFTQAELNAADSQRANTGNAYLAAFYDYSASQIGVVSQPVQVTGTGNDPGAAGTFTGPSNALFTVQITTAGVPGTAVYKWKKGDGAFTTGVVTDVGGSAQDLQDGVQVYFPLGVSYTLNDVWVISAVAGSNAGLARFEIYPHVQMDYCLPYLYIALSPDISDPGFALPRTIDGNMLLEFALAQCAMWPGPSADHANPYYRLELADRHNKEFQRLLMQAERNDEETSMQDVKYQEYAYWPYAPIPWASADWLQKHDF